MAQPVRKKIIILEHVIKERPGYLLEALRKSSLPVECVLLSEPHPPLPDPKDLAGLVIMGGYMDVDETDQFPFLAHEMKYIENVLKAKTPTLGVCLGGQLMAHVLGGMVYENQKREIGYYPLELTDDGKKDELLRHLGPTEMIFQWHRDTFEIPKGCPHLAKTPLCPAQAFRYQDYAWAFQFHLEVTGKMVRQWIREPKQMELWEEMKGEIDPVKIEKDTLRFEPRCRELAEKVFGGFLQKCRRNG